MPFDNTTFVPVVKHAKELEILDGALSLLQRRGGWIQGTYRKDQSYCLIGAIKASVHFMDYCAQEDVIQRLRMFLDELSVESWNDERQRRKSEVIDLVKRARASFE